MAALERDEFIIHVEQLHEGIKGVQDRLDRQNARIGSLERTTAVHADRFATMKQEAACEARREARGVSKRWGYLLASLGMIAELAHRWFGGK